MVFQARKWDWKRVAARLLLVPVLAGGSAAAAHAQQMNPPAKSGQTGKASGGIGGAGTTLGPVTDPKAVLKEGRKALAEGRFDAAQDLAQKAEANNPSGKWGLFDDTPNALRKDVEAARDKAKKAQAEQLYKQAKDLLHKKAANDPERAANLDTAYQMARKADYLHGPYSVWDMGDRPDKLVKEIEQARAKMKPMPKSGAVAGRQAPGQTTGGPPKPATGPTTAAAKPAPAGNTRPPAGSPSGATPASGTAVAATGPAAAGPATPVAPGAKPPGPLPPTGPTSPVAAAQPTAPPDGKKVAALRLMEEGKRLANGGDFGGAKAKFQEADKLGATFAATEYSPSFALQELGARGAAAITGLVKEADAQISKKDYAKADAALNGAAEIAEALSLFARPIEEERSALRLASRGKFGGMPAGGLGPVAGPEKLVAVAGPVGPVAPASPPGQAVVTGPAAPANPPTAPVAAGPAAPPSLPAAVMNPANPVTPPGAVIAAAPKPTTGGSVSGRQLLDQATLELRKGDLEMARKLAVQAHNLGGAQDEARGLLNQIDAEAFTQKKMTAVKSFEAAVAAHENKDYGHALGVLVLIDPNLLPADKKARRDELMAACRVELDKAKPDATLVAAAATQQPPAGPAAPPAGELKNDTPSVPMAMPAAPNPPGTARVGDPKPAGPDNLATQADALRRVQFQKFRSEGLKVMADAQAAFGRGDTDVAMQMMVDYGNRVRAANLEPAAAALLMRPIDSKLEMFRVMKGQTDAIAREKKDKRESRELIAGRGAAEEMRKAEVQRLVRQFHALVKESKFKEAEAVALHAKQLDPDDPAIAALAHMAKMNGRLREQEKLKDAKERMVYQGLTDAEQPGEIVTTDDPVRIRLEVMNRARLRGSLDDVYLRNLTPQTMEIERKLEAPIGVEFNQVPLSLVIENLQTKTGLPFSWDDSAIEAEKISRERPVTEKVPQLSVRNFLSIVLEKSDLSFVIEHDVVKITTLKRAKGRLVTKVFSVADLVTPVPNFAVPDYANFEKMLGSNAINTGRLVMPGLTGGATPLSPPQGLAGGTPAGAALNTNTGLPGSGSQPGISGTLPFGGGGTLQNQTSGGGGPNPLSGSASLAPDRNTKHEQLIKLITGMVRPYSWDGMGGPGRVEYFDLGSALVVNQTADVISEVAALLEALRRLQDLAIAVEVRIISLSETFFERMGVDFSMNIKTHTGKFEPNLTSGVFRPEPFVNDINNRGVTVGLSPAGTGNPGGGSNTAFTPDLDVPVRATSFQYAIPGFGGYPNNPGFNGGVSLGLAFLNDIQVFLFMEAAQGDRRVNFMQAPKLTLFNGQTATISITNNEFVVTNVAVVSVNGQIVFVPSNNLVPGLNPNITIAIQGVVSADRRFVRLNLPITLAAMTGATVPLFPITTFITPVFEGGSQGIPIPFTQFLQQPAFNTLTINTTVICPDGGTALMGGLKTLSEGRNEFGPPFLSKIPYLNRLFKNVGIGRETRHIMIMVTPRIIINAEEEINQTEGRPPLPGT